MLKDVATAHLVDYPKLYDGFPGVKIRGGVSYFLWDRDYSGPCAVQTMWDGSPLARRCSATSIPTSFCSPQLSGLHPRQGIGLSCQGLTGAKVVREYLPVSHLVCGLSFMGIVEKGTQETGQGSWLAADFLGQPRTIPQNQEWLDEWKVLMSAVQGTSAAVRPGF